MPSHVFGNSRWHGGSVMMIRQDDRQTAVPQDMPQPSVSTGRSQDSRNRHTPTHDWSLTVAAGCLLWFEAILLWSSANLASYLIPIVAIFGTLGLFLHLPPLTSRLGFRFAIGLLFLLFLVRLAFFPPPATDRGFVVIPQTPTFVLAEFFFSCQCLLLWRWRWQDPLPIAVPCIALITSILALNQTLSMGMQSACAFLVALTFLLPTSLVASQSAGSTTAHRGVPWTAHLTVAAVWVSALLGTWGATEAWSRWLPDAQTWFATNVGKMRPRQYQLGRYVTTGSLTAIRNENAFNPNAAALRVECKHPPGYLTGRVFGLYSRGQWYVDSDDWGRDAQRFRSLQPLQHFPDWIETPERKLSTFVLRGARPNASLTRMTIENDPRRGTVFFTPLGWCYMQAAGTRLNIDEFDIVHSGISVNVPYVVHSDPTGWKQPLNERLRQRLLALPSNLDPKVTQLANEVCRNARTTRAKVEAIQDYFQNSYEYSLEPVTVPRGVDPLNHFLLARHPAHCEFFASGAVALLRAQGIPARYATGYRLMSTNAEKPGYWVARNRDAHAWAEAYDEERQKWVVVEATPGFDAPAESDTADEDLANAGPMGSGLQFAADNANAIVQWWYALSPTMRFFLVVILLTLSGTITFVVVRKRAFGVAGAADPRVRHWQHVLGRMDRRLKSRGVVRDRAETLHQFARRLRTLANEQDTWLKSSANWYVAYAQGRFRAVASPPPALPPKRNRKPGLLREPPATDV